MLIKGKALNERQRAQVLAAFIYRRLDTTCKTDDEWIAKHAFHFVKDGSRLASKPNHCEPEYMADLEEQS